MPRHRGKTARVGAQVPFTERRRTTQEPRHTATQEKWYRAAGLGEDRKKAREQDSSGRVGLEADTIKQGHKPDQGSSVQLSLEAADEERGNQPESLNSPNQETKQKTEHQGSSEQLCFEAVEEARGDTPESLNSHKARAKSNGEQRPGSARKLHEAHQKMSRRTCLSAKQQAQGHVVRGPQLANLTKKQGSRLSSLKSRGEAENKLMWRKFYKSKRK